MVKKILITGGAGFVGSSLAIHFKKNYPAYSVVALDNLKRRGSELNVARLTDQGITFVHGDIRNREDFDPIGNDVTTIIDASAEPSVLAGLNGSPDYLINTNLAGTVNCLNFARTCRADFVFLSTSRVYPINQIEDIAYTEAQTRFAIADAQPLPGISRNGISEDFPLTGYRSLYGASKLASELLIQEYHHFYHMKTVINRCGVLTGPWQMGKADQGVVVLWMARHYWKQPLSYIGYGGTGKQIRDLLHVDDLYRLVDYQVHHLDSVNGDTFNVGGGISVSASLQELTHLCQRITGNQVPVQPVTDTRAADIRIYVTDNSKVIRKTGWTPQITVDQTLEDIHAWIKGNEAKLEKILK